ncbi:hypothetical protein LCGC14_2720960 [marine sediment metagenome]|uniref:Uncharacterized protein n=1 Tax=marine sediment metagenome TaxID=412755 RepID=A0A0F9C1U4_9ZZZZ
MTQYKLKYELICKGDDGQIYGNNHILRFSEVNDDIALEKMEKFFIAREEAMPEVFGLLRIGFVELGSRVSEGGINSHGEYHMELYNVIYEWKRPYGLNINITTCRVFYFP